MSENGDNGAVLVIGAGIAGIEASLVLAEAGRRVYLVEKKPNVGGNVIKLEDAFPSMECVGCMVTPKLEELMENDNISFLGLSEVTAVDGSAGDFSVKIHKRARYVDLEACIGCGACYDPCPAEVENEFEEGLSKRKAIFIPCAGALPAVPVVDTATCLRFKGEDCQACGDACVFEAIDFDQQDERIEVRVDAIIVATGFASFDPSDLDQYGYKKIPDVYTAMEVERLCSSNGPTQGQIVLQDGRSPGVIAIVHCVGREERGYCSSICCVASLKLSEFIGHKLHGVKVSHFITDLCLPGRKYQRFYEKVRAGGAEFHRAVVTGVSRSDDGLKVSYVAEGGETAALTADMVILSPALEAASGAAELGRILGIPQDRGGFFSENQNEVSSVVTPRDGVFVAGCAQSPKDIAETVAHAEAAAGRVLSLMRRGVVHGT